MRQKLTLKNKLHLRLVFWQTPPRINRVQDVSVFPLSYIHTLGPTENPLMTRWRTVSHLVFVSLSFCVSANFTWAGLLTDYNLVVIGDRNGSSEVEGRVLIGGNANGSFSNVGFNGGNLGNASPVDSLTVLGNLTANANIQSGRLRVLGAISGQINNNSGNSSNVFYDSTTAVPTRSQIANELTNDSTYFSGLTSTGTVTLPQNVANHDLVLNGHPNANGLTVFAINGSILNDPQGNQIRLNANGASNIVINVTGTNVVVGHTFGGDFSNLRSHILFNFVNASTLSISNQFTASILAPLANFNSQNANVDGGVFVNQLTQSNEIHVPY